MGLDQMRFVKRLLIFSASLMCTACSALYDHVGGDFEGPPEDLTEKASPLAKELIIEAREGFESIPGAPVDHHFHLIGLGTGIQSICPDIDYIGIWLNPYYSSWAHPFLRLRRGVFLSASAIGDPIAADAQFVDRVLSLIRNTGYGGTYYLYALDWRYEREPNNVEPNRERTDLYVSNQYVLDLARCLNALPQDVRGSAKFEPVASVHPYRRGALRELRKLGAQGVRFVKWLPPVQKFNPSDENLVEFYQQMQRLGLVLLSHTGEEHALRVEADIDQDLGNPSHLKLALDQGVTVVMLHSGRDGVERRPGIDGLRKPYFDRFLEIMGMKEYSGRLFGEISVVPYVGTHHRLKDLMADSEIRCRLVDGSDYPTPAISIINPTRALLEAGFLRRADDPDTSLERERKRALDEIYSYNPILFDFVLKRTIRVNGEPIPPATFYSLDFKLKNPRDGCPS